MTALTIRSKTALLLSALALLITCSSISVAAVPDNSSAIEEEVLSTKPASYLIKNVKWEQTEEASILRIEGNSPPTYTMYELFDPLRVIIDIADAKFGPTANLPLETAEGPADSVKGTVLEDKDPLVSRLEIFLNEDYGYSVERDENDIVVKFTNAQPDIEEEQMAPLAEEEAGDEGQADQTPGDGEQITAESSAAEAQIEQSTRAAAPPLAQPTADTPVANELFGIDIDTTIPGMTRIILQADGQIPDYKDVVLPENIAANRPDRMYIDIDNIKLANQIPIKNVETSVSRIRTARRDNGVRIVFDSNLEDRIFDYEITPVRDGLAVTIKESTGSEALLADLQKEEEPPPPAATTKPTQDEQVMAAEEMESGETQMGEAGAADEQAETIQPVIPLTHLTKSAKEEKSKQQPAEEQKPATRSAAATKIREAEEDLAFAGYEKQRITVDFFKIDLHNVFRLFGEISGLNIVIDEGVGGSLTLALNDVPWDFALDIILNLKGLQKEERFNTIVISRKDKKFEWPERALDKIEFQADETIIEEEGLSVKPMEEMSPGDMEAKKVAATARQKEQQGKYAEALALYEEAFSLSPDNANLATKIAALSLVKLGMNAKAAYYAKAALNLNPINYDAALQAAIALANMKRIDEAKEYFDLAISGPHPSSEALISYAAFAEENESYSAALSLLTKNEELYGDTLHTMIGKARLYDKMGETQKAVSEFRAILLSGFDIPPDLSRYIKGRIAMARQ